jgi:predicted RNA-binding Zn ribbon-like protein
MANGSEFQLNAGNRALDFINTLDNTGSPDGGVDSLPDYTSLLRFCEATGALCGAVTRALNRLEKAAKGTVMHRVPQLRDTLRNIFSAIARDRPTGSRDLAQLNNYLEEALRHRRLSKNGEIFAWDWTGAETDANSPLWPIVLDAAELLTSERLTLVRECDSETCGWLFLDTSKNHSRRWCDMKVCGNRFKARSYYQRLREAAEANR